MKIPKSPRKALISLKKALLPVLLWTLMAGCSSAPRTLPPDSVIESGAPSHVETLPPESETESTAATAGRVASEEAFTTSELPDGSVCITGFTGEGGEIIIPAQIGGKPVSTIGQYAFEAKAVTALTIPEGVTTIEEQAFLDCIQLMKVSLPKTLQTLGRAAFAGCTRLEEITLPENVTETDEELFTGCPLKDLYVQGNVEYQSWGLEELDPPCTIHAPEGSPLLTWAQTHGFPAVVETAE